MSIPKHISNYFKFFGVDEHDFCECECGCGGNAKDFHHLIPRSAFGSKRKAEQDSAENVVCITRECHERAHKDPRFNNHLKLMHRKKMLGYKVDHGELKKYIIKP